MVDVHELEKRWKRYKIKQFLPYAILLFSAITAGVILLFIQSSKEESLQPNTSKDIIKQHPIVEKNEVKIQKPKVQKNKPQVVQKAPQPAEDSSKTVLKPSLNFLKKLKNDTVVPQTLPETPVAVPQEQVVHVEQKQNVKKEQNLQEEFEEEIEPQEEERQEPKVKIEVKPTSAKEIEQIVRRFKKTNNPILSLFIAKKYYEMGNYNQSYNYALITNQIDNTIEDSWIIFAKSLVKLKQKGRAIKILKAYISKSDSNKAKILLDNIKTGKFQ
jgi:hypothetical protein